MRTYTYTVTTARFLSPDPYVQSPTNSQNYNRYSYCLNNPLKYNDPSGEFWHIVIGAVVGGVVNLATNWKNCDGFWEYTAAFCVGAGTGAATAATGGASMGVTISVAAASGAATSATNTAISESGKNFSNVDWEKTGYGAATGTIGGLVGSAVGYGVGSGVSKLLDKTSITNLMFKNVTTNIAASTTQATTWEFTSKYLGDGMMYKKWDLKGSIQSALDWKILIGAVVSGAASGVYQTKVQQPIVELTEIAKGLNINQTAPQVHTPAISPTELFPIQYRPQLPPSSIPMPKGIENW